jgi:hypothetical protein
MPMKKMKFASCALLLWGWACATAQQIPAQPPQSSTIAPADINPMLAQLEQAAHTTSLDLAHLRIEKWKTDRPLKDDATSKAQSLERNLASALPEMITAVRAAPGSITPALKLYRNLNVVYDVLATVAESAGAFGSKEEFRALAADLEAIDSTRRTLADALEQKAAAHDAELIKLRNQSKPAASSDVRKIVIDDNDPAPKPRKKKVPKPPAPAASNPQ